MKKPQTPPNLHELMRAADPARLRILLDKLDSHPAGDRYLHWDEFRRRPAPDGMSVHEAWIVTKLRRQAGRRTLPVVDGRGKAFSFIMPPSLEQLLHRIDRGLGSTLGRVDDAGALDSRRREVTLLQESITSSQLEGAATTRAAARELLRSGRPPRDEGERMVRNNYLTMQRVKELRAAELTPDIVLEIHRLATKGTLKKPEQAGRLRAAGDDVRIEDGIDGTRFHLPPASESLPARMAAMCAFANARSPAYFLHPVVRAIVLHFWLAYDHPFVDGNGRTARALFYWSVMSQDYALFEYISISEVLLKAPVPYYAAFLHSETDDNDLTYFILHQAQVIQKATEALNGYIVERRLEDQEAVKSLGDSADLNPRQRAVMAQALGEPRTSYLIPAHMRSHEVSHQTARDDLVGLAEKSLLTKSKSGRSYVFTVPDDLRERLGRRRPAEGK